MERRHRFVLAPVATLIAGLCAACGGNSVLAQETAACPQQTSGTTAAPTAVTMWALPIERKDLAALADQFNASHPTIHVSVDGADNTDWLTAVHDHKPIGDISEVSGGLTQVAIDSGTILPVQDCIDAAHYPLADFLPADLAFSTIAGRQWALPLGYPPLLLMYNRAAFSRAGLDPDKPPATLDELLSDTGALQRAGMQHPIAGYLWPWETFNATNTPIVNAGDGHSGRATGAALDTSDAAQVLASTANLATSGAFGPGPPKGFDPLWDLRQIGSGQAAITIHQGWDLRTISDALAKGEAPGVTLAVAAIPSVTGAARMITPATPLFISSHSAPDRRAAAWAFLRWFEEPAQQVTLHRLHGFFPTRRSAAANPAAIAFWQQYPLIGDAWALLAGRAQPAAYPLFGAHDEIIPNLTQALTEVGSGTAPSQALAEARTAINQSVAAYNADPVGYAYRNLDKIRGDGL